MLGGDATRTQPGIYHSCKKKKKKYIVQVLTEMTKSENQLRTKANHKKLQNHIASVLVNINRFPIRMDYNPVL